MKTPWLNTRSAYQASTQSLSGVTPKLPSSYDSFNVEQAELNAKDASSKLASYEAAHATLLQQKAFSKGELIEELADYQKKHPAYVTYAKNRIASYATVEPAVLKCGVFDSSIDSKTLSDTITSCQAALQKIDPESIPDKTFREFIVEYKKLIDKNKTLVDSIASIPSTDYTKRQPILNEWYVNTRQATHCSVRPQTACKNHSTTSISMILWGLSIQSLLS